MTHALDVIRSTLVNLLVIGAILAVIFVLVMAWRAGRRRQLVVAELLNSTGYSELDGVTRGLTQLARQRIDLELRVVAERREKLYRALRGAESDPAGSGGRGRRSQLAPARVQQRLDNNLDQLLTAAREVAPQQAQPAVQFMTVLVSRPRGLLVSGILQCRAGPRWGVSFDVLRVDTNRSVASHTLWESTAQASASGDREQGQPDSRPTDADMTHERILALLAPAGRWVAIQLVMQSVFPRGARGQEKGLDRLLSGVLYWQSAEGSPKFADIFRRLAWQDLRDAAETLKEVPLPLAALADTLDLLAAKTQDAEVAAAFVGTSAAEIYELAHKQYARALHALGAMPSPSMAKDQQGPPEDPVVQRIRVRQAISWLASGLPDPRHDTFRWIKAGGPDITTQMSADDLYDAASLYALAARDSGERPQGKTAALRLLQALHRDPKLWAQAERDGYPVAELRAALANNAQPPASWSGGELDSTVDQLLVHPGNQ
jgi:hypothetical protein